MIVSPVKNDRFVVADEGRKLSSVARQVITEFEHYCAGLRRKSDVKYSSGPTSYVVHINRSPAFKVTGDKCFVVERKGMSPRDFLKFREYLAASAHPVPTLEDAVEPDVQQGLQIRQISRIEDDCPGVVVEWSESCSLEAKVLKLKEVLQGLRRKPVRLGALVVEGNRKCYELDIGGKVLKVYGVAKETRFSELESEDLSGYLKSLNEWVWGC